MVRFLLALLWLSLTLAGPASAKSLALIIGNDSYENLTVLQKARADATGYAELFTGQGFDVTLKTDLSGRDMGFELATFFDRIAPGDTVVFVYSGHGWSDGSQNYLLPTDMRVTGSQTLLARESFALRNGVNGVVDEIAKRGAALVLAVIDACRDNPFEAANGTRSVGMSRGLVPVNAPSGTFVAFSAGAGQTALDRLSNEDPAQYSVFTRHFLAEMAKPNDLQTAFKRTQQLVNEDAARIGHPQRPAYYDEVIGSACLSGDCDPVLVTAPEIEPEIQPEPDLDSRAAQAWEAFKNSNSINALTLFAKQYEGTAYAALARERIAGLQETEPEQDAEPEVIALQPKTVEPPKPTPTARRPGWCANAATPTERAICGDDVLSTLDIEMAASYGQQRRKLSGAARSRYTAQQKQWLRVRNQCGADRSCLERTYRARPEIMARY